MKNKDLIESPGSLSGLFSFGRLHDMIDNLERAIWSKIDDFNWHVKVFQEMQPKSRFPKVNVIDEPESYKIEIAMAGFGKEDLELELKDNCLFIEAECTEEEGESTSEYMMKEIAKRSFHRVIRFPLEINTEEASCTYKDGIATCIVGKKLEEKKEEPIKIKIE